MKQTILVILLAFSLSGLYAQVNFQDYFENKSLRVDFVLSGNSSETNLYFLQYKKEPHWGGPQHNLNDHFDYGEFQFELLDKKTGQIIFKRGFCTLYEEWKTTAEAKKLSKAFYQSIQMPFPKNKCSLRISNRKRDGKFEELFSSEIDPSSYFISPEMNKKVTTEKLIDSGDSQSKVDLAFLAEGYSREEMNKFKDDVKRISEYILSQAPFNKHRDKINVWLVNSISQDSGTDIPGKGVYKKTALGTSFYTFDIDRYMSSEDYLSIRDYAANVPYDHICVLVNSKKYGGGGIYNHFSMGTSDHPLTEKVYIHELGHGFGALGDEYYSSDVAYQDFFNLEIEPWQANLTTLVDFDRKWKNLIADKTPVPTPANEEFWNKTGVFEGGGYTAKGMYRPAHDCRMKSNQAEGFCEACQQAIERMILFTADEPIKH